MEEMDLIDEQSKIGNQTNTSKIDLSEQSNK